MDDLMRTANANTHQEGHELARRAKKRYDAARDSVVRFLNARKVAK